MKASPVHKAAPQSRPPHQSKPKPKQQLNEESLKQRSQTRAKRMTRSGGDGSGGGGGAARRRRIVKRSWKGWRISIMKLYMLFAILPGIPMMNQVDIANKTKTTPQVKVDIGRWLRDKPWLKKKKQCPKPKNQFVIRDDKVEEYKKYSETRDQVV